MRKPAPAAVVMSSAEMRATGRKAGPADIF
jgi:hypothetical protein